MTLSGWGWGHVGRAGSEGEDEDEVREIESPILHVTTIYLHSFYPIPFIFLSGRFISSSILF